MLEKLTDIISPLSFLIWLTFVFCLNNLKKNNDVNRILISIMTINFFSDTFTIFFLYKGYNILSLYNLYFFLHNFLWIYFSFKLNIGYSFLKNVLLFFLIFSLINFTIIEKQNLNYNTFILGALIYIVSFIYISYFHLKNENLNYFLSNQYLLQTAPVLFFVGLTFVYAFRNSDMRNIIIYNKTDIYTFIGTIVNIIYYGLINLYIFKERKQHA